MKKILFTLLLCLFFIPKVDADSIYSHVSYCGGNAFPLQNAYIPANGSYTCSLSTHFLDSNAINYPYLNLIVKSKSLHNITLSYSNGANAGVFNQSIINYSPIQTDANGNTSYVVQLVQGGNGSWGNIDGYRVPLPEPNVIFHNWTNSNSYFTIVTAYMTTEQLDVNSATQQKEMLEALERIDLTETNENLEEVKESVDGVRQDILDLNESINSSDIEDSEGIAGSFFDDFKVTDNGGISAVVTAPLSAIEKMVSGTCTPIEGTYKGKEFSFPCGDTFWAEMPDVKQFLNIVLGGFLCYGILAKLYLLIDRLKDPEDDRVDVMKL